MMNIPVDCKFTKDHEWIRADGSEFVVGITDFAQSELGDVVFVDLPAVGKEVKQGEALCQVESVKAVSDVYAPVDGKVIAVNAQLSTTPELVNTSPYKDAWLVRLSVSHAEQLTQLMDSAAYAQTLGTIAK